MAKPPSDKYVKKVEARQKAFQEGKKGKGGKPVSKAAETAAEKQGEGRSLAKDKPIKVKATPADRFGTPAKSSQQLVKEGMAKADKLLGGKAGRRGLGAVVAVDVLARAAKDAFEASDIGFSDEFKNLTKPVPKSTIDQNRKHKRTVIEGQAKLAGRDQGQPSSRAKPQKTKSEVPKAPAKRKLSEFESAFSSARKGGAKEFEFKGKKYNTKLKGEK